MEAENFYILVYLKDFIFFSTVFSGIKFLWDFSIQSDDYMAPISRENLEKLQEYSMFLV